MSSIEPTTDPLPRRRSNPVFLVVFRGVVITTTSKNSEKLKVKWRQYFRAIGPGLITGASDDDPSGIATYAQAGSKYGLSFLWAALLTFPLMAAVQEICDRTALATGTGLGELAEQR